MQIIGSAAVAKSINFPLNLNSMCRLQDELLLLSASNKTKTGSHHTQLKTWSISRRSSNSYEFGRASRQHWSPSTRAQRAAERRAELAGSLVAADELGVVTSSSAVSGIGGEQTVASNKWQSISALERSCNFNRLKKGYASVRKSFRLPEKSQRGGGNVAPIPQAGVADSREELESAEHKRGLVGQFGVGAARLLRGVYQKGRQANQQHLLEADSISSTTGSFKVLTPSTTYSYQPSSLANKNGECNNDAATSRPKKSVAELEIEQRLQRSKRRVLPSASYKAPGSDKACDGLNLEELEEIKRDNLRLTLLKSQTFLRLPEKEQPIEGAKTPDLSCSCKALEPGGETKKSRDDYCCCPSISSSFSSLNASHTDLNEGEEFVAVETDEDRDKQNEAGDSSRVSGGFVGDKIFRSMEEIVAQGGELELEKVCGKPTLASSLALPANSGCHFECEKGASGAQVRASGGLADNNCDDGQLGGVRKKSLLLAPNCRTTMSRAKQDSTKQHANGGGRTTEIHSPECDEHRQSNECDDHQSSRVAAPLRPKVTTTTTKPTSRVVKTGKIVKQATVAHLSLEDVHNSRVACCGYHVIDDQSVEIISNNQRKNEEQHQLVELEEKMMFHEHRRGNYLEDSDYGACQRQQLHEQHLYASISSSPHTPSPTHHYEQHQHQWRRMSQDYDYSERQLYEKQLHHLYPTQDIQNETTEPKQSHKKSLFSRLKHLIIAPANSNQQTGKSKQWDAQSLGKQHELHAMRWQKSATLNSRSAQNLLGNSLRAYLSTSRKSINLAELNETAERENGAKLGLKPLTSGFFTLGRRGLNQQSKYDKPVASQLFIQSGSVDSLPSADSGMSCGNLQVANSNSSDENYSTTAGTRSQANPYSHAPRSMVCDKTSTRKSNQQQVINTRKVIGRARAKVDCNPCAYDKEALVFKCGDIIEILERNQSGTWVGQCDGQVGHFKFINVTELIEERTEEGSDLVEKANYVTKLEIKNNRMELQQQPSFRQRPTGSGSKPNSKIVQQEQPPPLNRRSSSTETNIMSSLEQLLFAIGLADERIAAATTVDQRNQLTCSSSSTESYLDILNRGGIKSLDSFSEINGWHELEQMGIRDDEHQRRLLMAARIIRQASMAAKLDFVENYRLSKSKGGSGRGSRSNGRQTNGFDQSQRQQQYNHHQQQQQEPKIRKSIRGDVNEPIYVNLVDGGSGGPIVCSGAQVEKEVHDLDQEKGWQPLTNHRQHASNSPKPNRKQNALSSARLPTAGNKLAMVSARPSRGWQASEQQADFYIQNRPIKDSINQSADHYRAPSNWLAGRESRPAGGSERGTPIEGAHRQHRHYHYQDYRHQVFDLNNNNNNNNDDDDVSNVDYEDEDDDDSMIAVDGTSPLVRGYSMRVSRMSRNHPKNNNNNDLKSLCGGHGQIYCVPREQPPPPPPPRPNSQPRRFHGVRGDTSVGYSNFSDHYNRQAQTMQTTFNPNGRQPAARVSRIIRVDDKQEIGNKASLRSQFNSKSAYDLRLDLSHFFS